MLVDLIPPHKLPWIVVWLDWNLFAFWPSLIAFAGAFVSHYWVAVPQHHTGGLSLALFIGFCAWAVYCAIRYGYAVG